MTTAEAILAVLGPIGSFLATLATLFLRRHFKFLDKIETRLDESGKLDAELATELRLSREARDKTDKRLTEIEQKLGAKIDDHRVSELRNEITELRTQLTPGAPEEGVGETIEDEDRPAPRSRLPSKSDRAEGARSGARTASGRG